MKTLTFSAPAAGRHANAIRSARFEERSLLPPAAACVVAGNIRETLSSLLGTPLTTGVLEPSIPNPQAWAAIACGALLYRVRGSVVDAAIVLRAADAHAIAAAAFGERSTAFSALRDLSTLERDALERAAGAIAGTLVPITGMSHREPVERLSLLSGYVAYFEVSIEPLDARVGIAVSREPQSEPHPTFTLDDLASIALRPQVRIAAGTVTARRLAGLRVGTLLPLGRTGAFAAALRIGNAIVARGECGARDDRYAFSVTQ